MITMMEEKKQLIAELKRDIKEAEVGIRDSKEMIDEIDSARITLNEHINIDIHEDVEEAIEGLEKDIDEYVKLIKDAEKQIKRIRRLK